YKLLATLLLMYPIIGAIFGASKLASIVVMNGAENIAVQIIGAGISVIPLFIAPVIMKTAGGVLNRFAGIVNNADKGLFDRMKKGAAGLTEAEHNRRRARRAGRADRILNNTGRFLGDPGSRRRRAWASVGSVGSSSRIAREQKRKFGQAVADETEQELFAKRAVYEDGFAKRIAGGKAESLEASAQASVDKLEDESVKSREILFRAKFDPRSTIEEAKAAFEQAVAKNDTTGARAAQRILLSSGSKGIAELSDVITKIEEQSPSALNSSLGASIRRDITQAGLKGKDNALTTWSFTPGSTLSGRRVAEDTYKGLTPDELVGQSADNLRFARDNTNVITVDLAKAVLSNPNLAPKLSADKREVFE